MGKILLWLIINTSINRVLNDFDSYNYFLQCIGQTWYLANDMQMFLISPLIIWPLHFFPKLGLIWSGSFLNNHKKSYNFKSLINSQDF